jgi:hypothetical protein
MADADFDGVDMLAMKTGTFPLADVLESGNPGFQ